MDFKEKTKYRLLVVDDEILMRNYLSKRIPELVDEYEIVGSARDGVEAVSHLKSENIDVVLTDIKMPGMDGMELAKHIRENYPQVIVVVISGYNEFEYAQKSIKYGVFDYLLKPLNDDELAETLKNVSDRIKKEYEERAMMKEESDDYDAATAPDTVAAAKGYVLKNYMNNISLRDVADYCKVNESYLSDLFHKKTGEPYSRFLLGIRMEKAIELIRDYPNMKVKDIAEKVGFVNDKHFITVFKRYYNMTPGEYGRGK